MDCEGDEQTAWASVMQRAADGDEKSCSNRAADCEKVDLTISETTLEAVELDEGRALMLFVRCDGFEAGGLGAGGDLLLVGVEEANGRRVMCYGSRPPEYLLPQADCKGRGSAGRSSSAGCVGEGLDPWGRDSAINNIASGSTPRFLIVELAIIAATSWSRRTMYLVYFSLDVA